MSTEHLIRTVSITLVLLAAVGALATGNTSATVTASLEGMLVVLVPAWLDTLRVARREKHERAEQARRRDSISGISGAPDR